MLGLPQHMQPQFFEWENGFYRAETVEARVDYGQKSRNIWLPAEDHVTNPRDDVMSMPFEVEVEGERPYTRWMQFVICCFSLGIAAMLTFIANYLAQNQELYQKIKVDKEFWKKQLMNFRMHAFINLNRICEADTEFHGVQFKQGDNIVVPSFVTDRDAATFPDPHNFNPERSKLNVLTPRLEMAHINVSVCILPN